MTQIMKKDDILYTKPVRTTLPNKVIRTRMFDSVNTVLKDFLQKADEIKYHHCEETYQATCFRETAFQTLTLKTNKKINMLNELFRMHFLHQSPNYKKNSLYVMSFNYFQLRCYAERTFNYNFSYCKDKKIKIQKLSYTMDKLKEMFKVELALMFKKYDFIYIFQVKASILKILLEFFNPDTFDLVEIKHFIENIEKTIVEDVDIIEVQNKLGLNTKNYIPKRRKKISYPTTEEYQAWLKEYGPHQLQKKLAETTGLSVSSFRRDMKRKGLVNLESKIKRPTIKQNEDEFISPKMERGVKGLQYNKKSDLVDTMEVLLMLNSHSVPEVKRYIKEKYGVSESTARRIVIKLLSKNNPEI